MSLDLNQCVIAGRLTADPELRTTKTGKNVTRFTVAVSRPKFKDSDEKTDFINCDAWEKSAEFLCKYFKKGQAVCVVGELNTTPYTEKNGNKRTDYSIRAEKIKFVESKSDISNTAGNTSAPSADFEEIPDDEELPF